MSYLIIYAIFAVATSLSSLYEIFMPALMSARRQGIKNDFTDSMYLSTFIFFLINVLIAPVMFLVIIIPGVSENAFRGICSVVHEPRKSDLE